MSRFESSVPSHKQKHPPRAGVFVYGSADQEANLLRKNRRERFFAITASLQGPAQGCAVQSSVLPPRSRSQGAQICHFDIKTKTALTPTPARNGPAQRRKSLTGINQRQKTKIFSPSKSGDFDNLLFIKRVGNLQQSPRSCFFCKKGLHPCPAEANILYSLITQASF